MILEHGYGERFGFSDAQLAPLVGSMASREELLAKADVVLLPKPQPEDLAELRDGQVLWGWPHCVQDRAITQLAIDKKLTLIAFEAMNHWASDGGFGLHVFHKNNELAGYCSVMHALALTGSTGDYGRRLSAVVIGFGATARGAVTALNAHGIHDVQVLTNRGVAAVGSPIHSVRIAQFDHDDKAPFLSQVITERGRVPLAPFLAESDIVVNCTLQDPNNPLTYLRTEDLARIPAGKPDRGRLLRRGHGLQLGAGPPPSPSRCSPWATTSTTTRWTTARPTSGTPPAGKSARHCCRSWRRSCRARPRGRTATPSPAPSKSATA